MGFSRQEYWSGLPFPSPVDHILSDLSTLTLRLGWPHMAWLCFIELDKAVLHVIRLASFLWLWFQHVCALMPSRNIYHLTWVSLTLDVGYHFRAAPAKHSHCSLLGGGVSPHGHPSWPWTWSSSSGPSCAYDIVNKLGLKQHIIIISQFVLNRNVALQIQTLTDCNQGILCL